MKIVADADLFQVREVFQSAGQLELLPGRDISPNTVRDADALLVRSVTRVDRALLQGSRVRFVGSATSGLDHVDQDYLREKGIELASARGSNAEAVADYCVAAAAWCADQQRLQFPGVSAGIVGAGATGSAFARRLQALGARVRLCDPPLALKEGQPAGFCDLGQITRCQLVSLHVPLTAGGDHPTHGLIGADFLAAMPEGAVLINTCRGAVVREDELVAVLQQRRDLTVIMDVWDNEPLVNPRLARLVDIATPHIAGYSQQAKRAGVLQLVPAFNACFGPGAGAALPRDGLANATTLQAGELDQAWNIALKALPLAQLSRDFKAALSAADPAGAFDEFRRGLSARNQFDSLMVSGGDLQAEQVQLLLAMGFAGVEP